MQHGARCPRPQCGGQLFERDVVTTEGAVRELFCHLCSRTWFVKSLAPYRPVRVRFRPEVEASLVEKADGFFQSGASVPLEPDHTEDIELAPPVRAAVDAYTASQD